MSEKIFLTVGELDGTQWMISVSSDAMIKEVLEHLTHLNAKYRTALEENQLKLLLCNEYVQYLDLQPNQKISAYGLNKSSQITLYSKITPY